MNTKVSGGNWRGFEKSDVWRTLDALSCRDTCWVKNETPRPLRLTVPFGELERREQMESEEHDWLLASNRKRYCADTGDAAAPVTASRSKPTPTPSGFEIGEHEML